MTAYTLVIWVGSIPVEGTGWEWRRVYRRRRGLSDSSFYYRRRKIR